MNSPDIPQRTFNVTRSVAPNLAPARLRAFTLVELLVVIVIISLLTAILVPTIQLAVEQGRRTTCGTKLQNLHKAAAAYAGANRTRVPVVHDGTGYGATGMILASGGRFAEEYMKQSWESSPGGYANMLKDDNVFQCPAALGNIDQFPDKKLATNYRLSGFGLYTGAGEGLRPSMMKIVGTVQSKAGGFHPAGEVAMAMDWIWSSSGSTSATFSGGMSLANHAMGANVLYGSGAVKWVDYESMITITSVDGLIAPPGTYGFFDGGTAGTHIYAPDGEVLPTTGVGDLKPGMDVMW